MNILTSLQKLAGRVRQQRFSRLATGIVSALAVCSATSVLGQVNVSTLGGGPGSTDVGTTPGSSVITFSGGSSGAQGIKLDNPLGLAFDSAGNLYIAENAQGNILRVTNPGNRNTSFTYLFATGLTQPVAVTVAPNGDVYVLTSPTGGGSILRYTTDGTFVAPITAALVSPTSFLLTDTGNFIVTEIGGTVKQVTPAGVVTTLTAAFTSPTGIAQYSAGQVAIADAGDNSIRQLNLLDPSTITLLAGGNGAGFTNGSALSAQFNMPRHIS
ncbi:MAG: hypothetical protein K0Q55_2868, partial [Verrucomicrobia bacterium]|nr:hypothetical protein [Verrucomicrobiota bacterium]